MNTRAKGSRVELEFAKLLKEKGFIVWKPCKCKMGGNEITSNDIFRLFDIAAIGYHVNMQENTIFLFQVKTNPSDFYFSRKKLVQWYSQFVSFEIDCEFYIFVVLKTEKKWKISHINYDYYENEVISEDVSEDFFEFFRGVRFCK